MPNFPRSAAKGAPDSLSLKVGSWLEAQATGRGIFVLAAIVMGLIAAGLAQVLISAGALLG